MKGNSEPGAKLSKRSGHRATGDLSEPAIRRQLRADAVQHPATLLPLAAFIMSVIYLLVLSPVLGGGIGPVVLLAVSGTVAAAAFIWRYTFRYTEEYAKRAQELLELMDYEQARLEQVEATQLREALQDGFSSIDAAEGLKALGAFVGEYEQLQSALRRRSDAEPLSLSHVSVLARETYQKGLSALSDALELMKVAGIQSRERLAREIAGLEKEVETSKGGENRVEWLRIKEGRLASHRQRLGMLDQLQVRMDQLLFQAERCEASLHRTRIEVAAIRTGSSETSVDSVIQALQATIHQVKEVQEELKRLGY